MADEGGEKTEMPTQKKLRDARSKGQVCTSKDIVSTALLILGFCLCAVLGAVLVDDFSDLMSYIASTVNEPSLSGPREAGKLAVVMICKHSFIFVLCAAVVGIAANMGTAFQNQYTLTTFGQFTSAYSTGISCADYQRIKIHFQGGSTFVQIF